MLRMVAFVALNPEADVDNALERLRRALADDDNVATAEVGRCIAITGEPPATYTMVLGFADRAAFERYSAGDPHQQFARFIRPLMQSWTAAFHETSP